MFTFIFIFYLQNLCRQIDTLFIPTPVFLAFFPHTLLFPLFISEKKPTAHLPYVCCVTRVASHVRLCVEFTSQPHVRCGIPDTQSLHACRVSFVDPVQGSSCVHSTLPLTVSQTSRLLFTSLSLGIPLNPFQGPSPTAPST